MSYLISIFQTRLEEPMPVEPIFEQRVEVLDLKAVFDAINRQPRRKHRKQPVTQAEREEQLRKDNNAGSGE